MLKRVFRGLLLIALYSQLMVIATAQTVFSEISGRVCDSNGAALSGVKVTVTEQRTNQSFNTTSNADGKFNFTSLKPGLYQLEIVSDGFKRFVRDGVQLLTGERARLDAEMVVGTTEEIVTVKADAPLLKTESGSLGQVITNEKILNLPLNGRNFIPLVALTSGVALPPGSQFPRINGGRPRTNEYIFDGISVLQPEPGQVAFFPIIDAIQEFKVETNSPSAEFGRFNGGVVNLTTRAGTNQFHGSVFEFWRNEALNARNLFAPRTAANPNKPVFRRNQFGFVFGGPVIRDRAFFFVDYQGTRQDISRVRISTVPTLKQRQGIFTEAVAGIVPQIYDPATTRSNGNGGFTRDRFNNNTIPMSRFDPIALTLLARLPLPNLPGTANNFRRSDSESQQQNQFDIRSDYRLSANDQFFARYSFVKDVSDPVTPLPDGSGAITTGTISRTDTGGQSLAGSYLHSFNAILVNELRFGYTRRTIDRKALLLDAPPSQSLQLPGIPTNAAFQRELPTFLIDGFQQLGPSLNANADFRTDVIQFVDTLSFSLGNHSIKTGGDLRWSRLDIVQPPAPTGQFRFSSLFTDLPGTPGSGFSLASFLLGQVQTFSIDLQQNVLKPRAKTAEFFVQDDWKVTDRLTINAGLRYTLNFPSTEADDQGAVFNLATQKLDYLGQHGFSRSARALEKTNFGPRLGLAYRFTDRSVVRAGYGLTWIEQAGITTPFTIPQFPFIQTVSQRSLDNINPAFQLANGPSVAPIALTPDAGLGQGVFGVARDLGSGYAQQWNLSLQQQILPDLTVEVAYTGSKITHLGIPDTNINQLTVDQLRMGLALLTRVDNPFFGQLPRSSSIGDAKLPLAQLLKPYPRFTTVSLFRNNVGNAIYHAFQLKIEKRFSQGLSFLISYTRSKLIDEASSVFDAAILTGPVANFPVADSFNRKLERDVSAGDIPNVFVASYVYDLPIGTGHRINANGLVGKLLTGWQIAGAVMVQSGLPLAINQATNFNAFAGFGTQRPNLVANPELPSEKRSVSQFFDVKAFTITPQFQLGSSSRNPLRGPGYRNTDLALSKRTNFTERVNLELRFEAFNLTNTPPLSAPNTVLGTAGFGSITSAGDPRVIQLSVKLNF